MAQKAFFAKQITKGKNAGKYRVALYNGSNVIIAPHIKSHKAAVTRWCTSVNPAIPVKFV